MAEDKSRYMESYNAACGATEGINKVACRPESIMLENLPKILLGISQKFPLLCLDSFLLCSIMLTVITAVSYVYTHN